MPQFILGRVIVAVAGVLNTLLGLYFWIVLIAVLLTWVNPDPRNPIVHFLYSVTEPVLFWIRRRLPFLIIGNFDLSPIALLLAIRFTQQVLVVSLYELAMRIGAASTGWSPVV